MAGCSDAINKATKMIGNANPKTKYCPIVPLPLQSSEWNPTGVRSQINDSNIVAQSDTTTTAAHAHVGATTFTPGSGDAALSQDIGAESNFPLQAL